MAHWIRSCRFYETRYLSGSVRGLSGWYHRFCSHLCSATPSLSVNPNIRAVLEQMLVFAGYPTISTFIHLRSYDRSVAPYLDAFGCWRSFMTDDHTPSELSWSWTVGTPLPTVRYSVDPVSALSGTRHDRTNLKTIDHFRNSWVVSNARTDIDWTWYDALYAELVSPLASSFAPPSQIFFGFDLLPAEDSMTLKAYFLPETRARREHVSTIAIVRRGLARLYLSSSKDHDALHDALRTFFDFLQSFPASISPVIELVGIDCVPTGSSSRQYRLKIYVRSRQTRFRDVIKMLTLGGRTPENLCGPAAYAALRELCAAVLGDDWVTQEDTPLRSNNHGHRTSGLLYYFEFRPGAVTGVGKVYLPVRHYSTNDGTVARGLEGFLTRWRMGLEGIGYTEALQKLCVRRSLWTGTGYQTYIACAVADGKVKVASYINPQLFVAE